MGRYRRRRSRRPAYREARRMNTTDMAAHALREYEDHGTTVRTARLLYDALHEVRAELVKRTTRVNELKHLAGDMEDRALHAERELRAAQYADENTEE